MTAPWSVKQSFKQENYLVKQNKHSRCSQLFNNMTAPNPTPTSSPTRLPPRQNNEEPRPDKRVTRLIAIYQSSTHPSSTPNPFGRTHPSPIPSTQLTRVQREIIRNNDEGDHDDQRTRLMALHAWQTGLNTTQKEFEIFLPQ